MRKFIKNYISESMPQKVNLVKNTSMLYIMVFSSYFFIFMTIPYQTRIMGPAIFGLLGFIASIMILFQLLIDFGFTLSATADVSKNRNNTEYISRLFSAVTYIKIALSLISIVIIFLSCLIIPSVRDNWWLYAIFLLGTISNAFIPDFIYRGVEKMSAITIRTVMVRLFFVVMVFVFLKTSNDYWVVPALNFVGSSIALVIVYIDIFRRFNIRLMGINLRYTIAVFKESSHYFYSRIATTIYGSGNTIILGIVSPGPMVGYYVASDKFISTVRTAMSPIADSVYPYMIKHKDYKLIKKILGMTMPFIILGTIILFIFAEKICIILFGKEFAGATPIFQALLPIVIFTLPNYLLGFPVLGALGLAKQANLSIITAAICQLVVILILYLSGFISALTLAITTTISELIILCYRLIVIYRHRTLLRNYE